MNTARFSRGHCPPPMTRTRQPLPLAKRLAPRENRPQEWADETIRQFLRNYIRWTLQGDKDQIFFRQYCLLHGVYPDDVQGWLKRDRQFKLWHDRCMEAEQVHVAFLGARNKITTVAAIFYLKSQHGWQDKQTVEHKGAVLIQTDIKDLTK